MSGDNVNDNVRKSIVSGLFYSNDFQDLNEQIEGCFMNELGPGSLPMTRDNTEEIKGVIVPHAAFAYSGACSAWAYKEIAETKMADVYIILSPGNKRTKSDGDYKQVRRSCFYRIWL